MFVPGEKGLLGTRRCQQPSYGELWRLLPSQLPILVPSSELTAGGSRSNPVIIQILWGVVAKQRNAPSSGPLGHIRLPVWGGYEQMLAGRNGSRLVGRDDLVTIELESVLDLA